MYRPDHDICEYEHVIWKCKTVKDEDIQSILQEAGWQKRDDAGRQALLDQWLAIEGRRLVEGHPTLGNEMLPAEDRFAPALREAKDGGVVLEGWFDEGTNGPDRELARYRFEIAKDGAFTRRTVKTDRRPNH